MKSQLTPHRHEGRVLTVLLPHLMVAAIVLSRWYPSLSPGSSAQAMPPCLTGDCPTNSALETNFSAWCTNVSIYFSNDDSGINIEWPFENTNNCPAWYPWLSGRCRSLIDAWYDWNEDLEQTVESGGDRRQGATWFPSPPAPTRNTPARYCLPPHINRQSPIIHIPIHPIPTYPIPGTPPLNGPIIIWPLLNGLQIAEDGYFEIPYQLSSGMIAAGTNSGTVWTNGFWGWVTHTIPGGSAALIGQPWMLPDYSIRSVFSWSTNYGGTNYYLPRVPHQTTLALWDRTYGVWRPFVLDWPAADWVPHGEAQLKPGSGALVYNPYADPITVIIEGVHIRGPVTNHIPAGWSVVCSINGFSGSPESLGFPVNTNIIIRRLISGTWVDYYPTNAAGGEPPAISASWLPDVPLLAPGEAFLVYTPTPLDWVQRGYAGIRIPDLDGPWLTASRSNQTVTVTGHNLGTNHVWTLLVSADLGTWQSLLTFTNTATDQVVWQGQATNQARFFRLRQD